MMRQIDDARRQCRPLALMIARRRRAMAGFWMTLALGCHSPAAAQVKPGSHPPGERATAPMPGLPPAAIDEGLAIGGEDIEGRKVSTRMVVAVQLNGQGPFHFVVDSGADTSVIGQRRARELHLPAGTPVTLHGTTASGLVDRVLVDELNLGQTTVHDLQLPVLQDRDLGAEGLIGIDALVEQRLMLDFELHTIRIEDARTPTPRLDGEIVVTARRRRGQLILTQARANDKAVDVVIDTGSEITIGNVALRNQLFKHDPDAFSTVEATGVTGITVKLQIARVRELRLGTVVFRDVPIAFADVPPFAVFSLADHPSLLLGTDLMETFRRVSLDFRGRKVRFQLRRCKSASVVIGTAASAVSQIFVDGGGQACRR